LTILQASHRCEEVKSKQKAFGMHDVEISDIKQKYRRCGKKQEVS
jgi:hypothetical protein